VGAAAMEARYVCVACKHVFWGSKGATCPRCGGNGQESLRENA